MAKHLILLFRVFQLCVTATILVAADAQSQSGFESIDCGFLDKQVYIDNTTQIRYTPDNDIDTGEVHTISFSDQHKAKSIDRQFENLRSFPEGNRNCYTLDVDLVNSTNFLIRARFLYGNYDSRNTPPKFDIYVGATWWDSVKFEDSWSVVTKEIIYVAPSEHVHVCLCNTNNGTPFISVLELRPIGIDMYGPYYSSDTHLIHLARFDLGSQNHKLVRSPDDDFDRIWMPYNSSDSWKQISNSDSKDIGARCILGKPYPPGIVMGTAITPANESDNIKFHFKTSRSINVSSYHAYLYYCDIQKHEEDETRDFLIYGNGKLNELSAEEGTLPEYVLDYDKGTESMEIWINRTKNSTLPSLLNAIEIYAGRDLLPNRTDEKEYIAMMKIRRLYGIKRNWQGDPCAPLDYIWDGIKCRHHGSGLHRIRSLNLSSSGLHQGIATDIADLSSIEDLDLSKNCLTGEVHHFLSKLHSLKVLKLEGNQFSGTIPPELLQKSKNGSLQFSFGGVPNCCSPDSCKKKPWKTVIITLTAILGGALILLVAVTFRIFKTKQSAASTSNKNRCFHSKPNKVLDSDKQEFTYDEVLTITNNFGRVLGKGAFGTVFHGYLGNNTEVAVKMLSPSAQGYQQFQAEAELLTKVHHKCLTALIGYCDEGNNVALIYEYMANGDLAEHLSAKSGKLLGWKERLQIAVDAAEGLEYLHNGCKPPIVHRDIKPQNILLNEHMRGKLGDFGLSKIFSDENETHVSTVIAGTRGYLAPDYFMSNRLNEKSDVFSFGIVLLEIITGQPAIAKTEERTHIIEWLDSTLREGEVDDVVDSRLHGEFSPSSVRKALDTAMACVKSTSINRPTMTQVVIELKECMAMEMTQASDNIPSCINESSIDITIEESSLLL